MINVITYIADDDVGVHAQWASFVLVWLTLIEYCAGGAYYSYVGAGPVTVALRTIAGESVT